MINIKKKYKNFLFIEIIKSLFEVLHRLFMNSTGKFNIKNRGVDNQ